MTQDHCISELSDNLLPVLSPSPFTRAQLTHRHVSEITLSMALNPNQANKSTHSYHLEFSGICPHVPCDVADLGFLLCVHPWYDIKPFGQDCGPVVTESESPVTGVPPFNHLVALAIPGVVSTQFSTIMRQGIV